VFLFFKKGWNFGAKPRTLNKGGLIFCPSISEQKMGDLSADRQRYFGVSEVCFLI